MKKTFIVLILSIMFIPFVADARSVNVVVGQPTAAAPASYCAGTELFCSTFESATTWDATNGTSDCDGYDTDGDYCDGDTTTYVIGAKSLGIMGSSSYYVQETLTSTGQSEFYIEGWIRFDNLIGAKACLTTFNSGTNEVVNFRLDTDATFLARVKDTATVVDSNFAMSADTWYHVGVYFKKQNVGNDGIVRIWINTSTTAGFSVTDFKVGSTTVDTGTYTANNIRFRGEAAGEVIYYDNMKVVGGSPSWTYE